MKANDVTDTCAACGATAGEAHHLVPRAIHQYMSGAMLERWNGATVSLCPRCHREWHDVVTPYLGGWGMTGTRKASAKWILAQYMADVAGVRLIRRALQWYLRGRPYGVTRWYAGRDR
ncbi:MAG: hypothetical protein GVY12_01050 [Bacteroidetes bacterium]|jgi:hypothetical protein|nr:hypothetical protein [Bacteroidota bacterium]